MNKEAYKTAVQSISERYKNANSVEEKFELGRELSQAFQDYIIDKDAVSWLKKFLIEAVPELSEQIRKDSIDFLPLDNEYGVFSGVIRPYIECAFKNKEKNKLEHIWSILEELASIDKGLIKDCLSVTLEEMDMHLFSQYMGPKIRLLWFAQMTLFIKWTDNGFKHNYDIDRLCYYRKWKEEIDKAGGFGKLTYGRISKIRKKVWQELGIEILPSETLYRLKVIRDDNTFVDGEIVANVLSNSNTPGTG